MPGSSARLGGGRGTEAHDLCGDVHRDAMERAVS